MELSQFYFVTVDLGGTGEEEDSGSSTTSASSVRSAYYQQSDDEAWPDTADDRSELYLPLPEEQELGGGDTYQMDFGESSSLEAGTLETLSGLEERLKQALCEEFEADSQPVKVRLDGRAGGWTRVGQAFPLASLPLQVDHVVMVYRKEAEESPYYPFLN